jgi:MscS family membrane protein
MSLALLLLAARSAGAEPAPEEAGRTPAVEAAAPEAPAAEPSAAPDASTPPADPVPTASAGSGSAVDEEADDERPPPRRARKRRTGAERSARELVPDGLERRSPLGAEWWQILGVPLLAGAAALIGRVLGRVTRLVATRVARATPAPWDDQLLHRSHGPLTLAWAFGVARAGIPFLFLPSAVSTLLQRGLDAGLIAGVTWVAVRATEIAGEAAVQTARARSNPEAASVLPMVARAAKGAFIALGVVAVLSGLGYPVVSLLAGLGIGGLAFALAFQKTAENLFGSVSIGVDQPFRVGDLIKVEDVIGLVEVIGLRSTRIRTPDRTVVTIPNGRLADMRVENFSVRDRMRLYAVLPLEVDTPAATVDAAATVCEATLRAAPDVLVETATVRLVRVGPNGVELEAVAWFQVENADAFALLKHRLFLELLAAVSAAGARLAHPARP